MVSDVNEHCPVCIQHAEHMQQSTSDMQQQQQAGELRPQYKCKSKGTNSS
jgi:hypothetical protein